MPTIQLSKRPPVEEPEALDLAVLDEFACTSLPQDRFPVVLSEKAVSMVRSALDETGGEDGSFLRVGVRGGGCAGLQYSLNFTDELFDDDVATVVGPVKVVTDVFSSIHLDGTELDYVESLAGSGFKFVNPNAKRTCGCGSSFAP